MAYKRISPMPVIEGGTGDLTLTNHGVLVGAGTSPIAQLSVGATGTVLIGNTGANPSFSTTPTVTSITISNAPVVGTDGTNKTYVDTIAAGFQFKSAVLVATTAALNATYLNGVAGVGATLINAGTLAAFSVDGQSPAINSRVLVKDQASTFQNGIYTLTTVGSGAIAWVLTRATDFDQPSEIQAGDLVPVLTGTVNADTLWLQNATVTTIGTDPITFVKFLGQGITTITGDSGGALTGSNITFTGGTTGLTFSGSSTTETLTGTLVVSNGGTGRATLTNHGLLVGAGTSAITQLANATNGQLPIGSTGVDPVLATLTAGTNISITNGAGTITIAASSVAGFVWSVITANQTASVNNGYFCNKAGTLALALPAVSVVGDTISVTNENTALGVQFTQAAGQQILIGNTNTTSGATGTLTSSAVGDTLTIVCYTANTVWRVNSIVGNWTPA